MILFDEPLSNLDAKLREETRKALERFLGELGITAVYVTHDRVEALALSDSIAVMRAGRIVEIGSPQRIYFDAQTRFVADFIGRANLVAATVWGEQGDELVVDSALGTLRCARRETTPVGDVTLCVRPEFLHLRPGEGAQEQNVVHGRIESLAFVGEFNGAEMRVGDTLLLARTEPDVDLHVGDLVHFSLDPAHCLLLAQ